jgi:hypothetical protein
VDVTLIAFSNLRGSPAAGGILLALFAGGSVLGALAFGARNWPVPQALSWRRSPRQQRWR